MRLSQLFFTTLRDDPADAEMVSHRLLVRAGYVRQLGSGSYSLLPLGFRVNKRVEQVIREEMDRIGSQEMEMPVVHPAEIWKERAVVRIGPEHPVQGPQRPRHGPGDDPRGVSSASCWPTSSSRIASCR
jgi:prolyl-tRNA synthetase